MFEYVKMLAEKQAAQYVRECVITVPNYYTYDQRLMIKDAAELANLKVLQLVHENTAAATMFAIDQKIEHEKNLTVLFYNMGGMDTEVSVIRYSMLNQSAKKSSGRACVRSSITCFLAASDHAGSYQFRSYSVTQITHARGARPTRATPAPWPPPPPPPPCRRR